MRRSAAFVLIVGFLLLAQLSAPALASTGTWTVVDTIASPDGSDYADIARGTTSGAWAVANFNRVVGGHVESHMVVKRWTGSTWSAMPTPSAPSAARYPGLGRIAVASPTSLWVSGGGMYPSSEDGSFFSHWDGHAWYTHDLGVGWAIEHLSAISPSNVWFLGTANSDSQHPVPSYVHWDGHRFWRGTLPSEPSGFSKDPYWVPAENPSTRQQDLLHFDGHRFVAVAGPHVSLPAGTRGYLILSALRRGANDLFVTVGFDGGEGFAPGLDLYHWDGSSWKLLMRRGSDSPTGAITTDGYGGLWIVSGGVRTQENMLHYWQGHVGNVLVPASSSTTFQIAAVTLRPGSHQVWAAGSLIKDGNTTAQLRAYTP